MTIFPRVSETLICLTAAADVTHRKRKYEKTERNGSCVSLFDGTGLCGKIISAVRKKSLQKILVAKKKKKKMSNAFNNFIAVSIQYCADFLLQFISVVAKVALSRGVSKHNLHLSRILKCDSTRDTLGNCKWAC